MSNTPRHTIHQHVAKGYASLFPQPSVQFGRPFGRCAGENGKVQVFGSHIGVCRADMLDEVCYTFAIVVVKQVYLTLPYTKHHLERVLVRVPFRNVLGYR